MDTTDIEFGRLQAKDILQHLWTGPYQMNQWKLSKVVGPLRFLKMELPRYSSKNEQYHFFRHYLNPQNPNEVPPIFHDLISAMIF
ncbi:hypothetical protein CTI12_AA163950 [Artemisia annua]|uniref:Uncharacterized protein n=1 Tax=Artemisia annua TaxID=35608 RepID=A0A2U1PBZ7_ARTAN|nr:hypothetical protein CTI12_AA163950 [Artemisia annua]